jgi:hypothetical protein
MSVTALDITDAEAAGLSELAALDLVMARDFAARAQAAEDPEVANDLARSYQRMARSYRQTLALKARLQRDIARERRENPPPKPPRDLVRIAERVEALREPCRRVIWAEHEPAEPPEREDEDIAGYYFDLLEERLARLSREDDGFGLTPLDEHVVAMCAELALPVRLARAWRDLPDPPETAFLEWPEDPADTPPAKSSWRSSA